MVRQASSSAVEGKIRCDACPVMCYIADGKSGACDRYANEGGELIRVDPFTIIENTKSAGGKMVPFLAREGETWSGDIVQSDRSFITAVGAGTTYPDYKPAPFIVSAEHQGVDTVTVVSEGIFSYCGVKVKIDTDRHLGAETTAGGRVVGDRDSGPSGCLRVEQRREEQSHRQRQSAAESNEDEAQA